MIILKSMCSGCCRRDSAETILEGYPRLDPEDIQACLVYARRLVGHERVEPLLLETGT